MAHRCNLCDSTFTFYVGLFGHRIHKHPEDRPYRCNKCFQTFAYMPSLVLHEETECVVAKKKKKGKIITNRKKKITNRIITTNRIIKKKTVSKKTIKRIRFWRCCTCEQIMSTRDRPAHMKKHELNPYPYKCNECPHIFSHLLGLKYHKQTRH